MIELMKLRKSNSLHNYLWGHVAFRANAMCWWYVNRVCFGIVTNSKSQVTDGATQVGLDENVLALQITVSYSRLSGALFALLALCFAILDVRSDDIHVQMSQAGGDRYSH